ncbi:MAG: hypothetical protein IKJ05_01885, partial [Oscillospiraceae bacterium]|nr:hypothetical protein [Oscillospiraceae bacterium]
LFAFTVVLALSMTACITINVTPQGDSSSQPVENTQPTNSSEENSSLPQTNSDTDKQDESQPSATPQPTPEIKETDFAMYDQWAEIVCWWNAAEGRFALTDMADSHTAVFAYGMWDTEFYKEGIVTYMYNDGEQTIVAQVDFDGETETVTIDYSGKERDGKIQIGINGEWMQYMFSGYTRDIAYQTYLDNING